MLFFVIRLLTLLFIATAPVFAAQTLDASPVSRGGVIKANGSFAFSVYEFSDYMPASALLNVIIRDSGISMPEGKDDVEKLNNILRANDLYNKFPNVRLPALAPELIKPEADLSEDELIRKNRFVLETVYPEHCPKNHAIPTLKEFSVLVGYGSTKVTDKDRYVTIPTYMRFGIDCDKFGLGFSDWIERGARDFFHKDFRPAGTTEFFIEPFLSYVPSPNQNMEGGFIIAFKYEWPLTEKFHPYIWNGGGVMYVTQHLREEALQIDFTPQIGGGFHYFIEKNKALNFEYRYRHFSNANLKLPNDGVNEGFMTVGVSWFY